MKLKLNNNIIGIVRNYLLPSINKIKKTKNKCLIHLLNIASYPRKIIFDSSAAQGMSNPIIRFVYMDGSISKSLIMSIQSSSDYIPKGKILKIISFTFFGNDEYNRDVYKYILDDNKYIYNVFCH